MRLDLYLVANGYFKSRTKAVESVERGEVFVNGKPCLKRATDVNETIDKVEIVQDEKPFVSIGGNKLKRAIDKLTPPIMDKTFIDVGASTGGFTDCLLRLGANKVFCVDVGENLLDPTIAENPKVVVMDKTNARFLTVEQFGNKVDGIVVDCSFISLEYILPPLINLLNEDGIILALIKPQFELKERVKLKHGILRNEKERNKVVKRLYDFALALNLHPQAIVNVTVDQSKNTEYIFYLALNGQTVPFEQILVN